ncbi:unnamed protein product [Adineta steineri]|uniref:poly(ADP-ribose) glycohydrolase n=1 Tax=Adineta steineri TaxID=433720 RepID=A0A819T347_9BILA|nr:unnamed protein product [Adineta steineri]
MAQRFMRRNDDDQSYDELGNDRSLELYDDGYTGKNVDHKIIRGPRLEQLVNICPHPPYIRNMKEVPPSDNVVFMIKPFRYDQSKPNDYPFSINGPNRYNDLWNEHYVRMPCSPLYVSKKTRQPQWPIFCQLLLQLKQKCDNRSATIDDLKNAIETFAGRSYNIDSLRFLITESFSAEQRSYFMSAVLANICTLALNMDILCSQPPPLLRSGSNRSLTMSQQQAASLLAASFFCLFPFRSDGKAKKEYDHFQNPNFNTLYQRGPKEKIEKLRCILHYFERITAKMPNGVITFQRYSLHHQDSPKWALSEKGIAPMHLTTGKRIEDINCVLQVDFANKYIGGGVLTAGCVQEEIRFSICPEMLVSLLVCEAMEPNECIHLIGCERYSSYKGYSATFQYSGDYVDNKPKDNWGRKWCHLVAIDALYFRDQTTQYHMKNINRELIKAYTGFYTSRQTPDCAYPVATGNWGCGAFNGDKQLKAIIQLIAASQTVRPLIYAAYGDKYLIESFSVVFDHLINQRATVGDLYRYLQEYSKVPSPPSLFEYILRTPAKQLRS